MNKQNRASKKIMMYLVIVVVSIGSFFALNQARNAGCFSPLIQPDRQYFLNSRAITSKNPYELTRSIDPNYREYCGFSIEPSPGSYTRWYKIPTNVSNEAALQSMMQLAAQDGYIAGGIWTSRGSTEDSTFSIDKSLIRKDGFTATSPEQKNHYYTDGPSVSITNDTHSNDRLLEISL